MVRELVSYPGQLHVLLLLLRVAVLWLFLCVQLYEVSVHYAN